MRTIWKFPLVLGDRQTVKMPRGAKVLTVQMQDGTPCIWAEVNSGAAVEMREFAIFGTGHRMPRDMGYSDVYLGTVQQGPFVWHVYELTGV